MPSVAKLLEEKHLLEQKQAETVEMEMHERNTEVSSDESLISFRSLKHAVMESVGVLEVTIVRSGNLNNTVQCRVVSRDGTATVVEDYGQVDQTIVFGPQATEQKVSVSIVDDDQYEPDEEFYLDLIDASEKSKISTCAKTCTIEIIDDDTPGALSFEYATYTAVESQPYLTGSVLRKNGADGKISVELICVDETAVSGTNYVGDPLVLEFAHHSTEATFSIPLIDTNQGEP